jgi:hypothetical protein
MFQYLTSTRNEKSTNGSKLAGMQLFNLGLELVDLELELWAGNKANLCVNSESMATGPNAAVDTNGGLIGCCYLALRLFKPIALYTILKNESVLP